MSAVSPTPGPSGSTADPRPARARSEGAPAESRRLRAAQAAGRPGARLAARPAAAPARDPAGDASSSPPWPPSASRGRRPGARRADRRRRPHPRAAQGRRRRRAGQGPPGPRPGPDGPRAWSPTRRTSQRMQQELVSLARRISELEDAELEVMERLETAQAEHQDRRRPARRDRRPDRRAGRQPGRARPATSTRAGRDRRPGSARSPPRACPPTCWRSTSRLRAQKGGVGAAALRQRQCAGCSLELTAADLGAIAEGPDRRGAALRGVQPDPGAHRRVRRLMGRRRAAPLGADRGRRRLPRQPGPGGVRRGAPRRRHPRGDRRARPSRRRGDQQRRGVPRA